MKIQIVFLNMSQFENKIIKAINSGLDLSSNMYEKQHYVGRFISGWKQPKSCSNNKVGHRKIDIQIKNNTIYRVSRKVNIEIDGCQHYDLLSKLNDPQYDQKLEN